jgi:asparagine synthase (glutamine-hydrolysing)
VSGIAGWAVPVRGALEEGALLPMLQALSSRHGAETLLGCIDRRRHQQVALGATLCDAVSGIAVALDGALANAAELRGQLARRGFAFPQGTGAEVLLRAYQYWDKDVVKQLAGAFAFALWDPRKDRLMLARDRFGEKPLFVQERAEGLFFASEAKALLAAPGARAQLDLAALRACIALRYVPGQATLFRGIRRLGPAVYAMWQFGRLQETRYWIPPDRNPWSRKGEAEAFGRRLEDAIAQRGGAGVLLSGGIDSAAMVAVLARQGRAVKTFSLGFEGDKRSELPQAAALAKHFATAHHEIVVKPAELLPALASLVERHDGPVAPSVLAMHRLAAEAARSEQSVLSGDGCDEVVGGYRKLVAERFHPGFCASLERRGERWAARLLPREKPAAWPVDGDPQNSSIRKVLYHDQVTRLPNQLLERNDRAGLEIRMPYLDHRLAEHVSGLPDDQRVRGLATKWVLREAARKLVPANLGRRKAGFRMPVRDWLRNELRDTLAEHLQGSGSQTRRYYDTAVLDRLVGDHINRKSNYDATLWTLLNLEIWHRRYRPG